MKNQNVKNIRVRYSSNNGRSYDNSYSNRGYNRRKRYKINKKRVFTFTLVTGLAVVGICKLFNGNPNNSEVDPNMIVNNNPKTSAIVTDGTDLTTSDSMVELPFVDTYEEEINPLSQEPVFENVIPEDFEEAEVDGSSRYYVRTNKAVNVRTDCNASNKDSIIDTLPSGMILEFCNDLNNGWYEVIYNGSHAYINAAYVDKLPMQFDKNDKVVIINGYDVNVRREPNASSSTFGTFQAGDCFSYLDTMDNGWYKIEHNGNIGYVSGAFSCLDNAGLKYESVNTVTSVGEDVNVRNQASTKGRVIYKLNKGDTLQYTGKLFNGWYEVLLNGHPGYVSGKYFKEGTRVMITNKSYAIVAAQRNTIIYRDSNFTEPVARMPEFEIGHVYQAGDDYYLIDSEQGTGYIRKNDATRLDSTCVVVDESDQITRAFRHGAPFFYADCTTGAPGTPTEKGIHQVRAILYDYYMKEWDVTVNVFIPFCRDQGFHGIKDQNGKKDIAKVVGKIVKESKRSHGCVREYDEDALFLAENLDVGTDVVVKR